jgi:hypothetical protein
MSLRCWGNEDEKDFRFAQLFSRNAENSLSLVCRLSSGKFDNHTLRCSDFGVGWLGWMGYFVVDGLLRGMISKCA